MSSFCHAWRSRHALCMFHNNTQQTPSSPSRQDADQGRSSSFVFSQGSVLHSCQLWPHFPTVGQKNSAACGVEGKFRRNYVCRKTKIVVFLTFARSHPLPQIRLQICLADLSSMLSNFKGIIHAVLRLHN
jgi:hypothetical protein